MATPDIASLHEWLDQAIDALPSTGQIVLNFDGNTVKWEIKAVHNSRDRNGDCERVETKRFGLMAIRRRQRTK